MSQTATIEVTAATPPPEGKKLGKVETTDGVVYHVWPDKLGLLRPGSTYEVQFSEDEFNGRTYRKIAKVKPTQKRQQQNGTPAQPQQPKSNASELEHDFVARTLAACIQAGTVAVHPTEMAKAVRMLRAVYRETMG